MTNKYTPLRCEDVGHKLAQRSDGAFICDRAGCYFYAPNHVRRPKTLTVKDVELPDAETSPICIIRPGESVFLTERRCAIGCEAIVLLALIVSLYAVVVSFLRMVP